MCACGSADGRRRRATRGRAARPVKSGSRARGLASLLSVGKRKARRKPRRGVQSLPAVAGTRASSDRCFAGTRRKKALRAPADRGLFDERWRGAGATRRVQARSAEERQRATFPPGARKTTPRPRGEHRGPRSKVRQDRCCPYRTISNTPSFGAGLDLGRACGREPEARACRQTRMTRAARGGLVLRRA